MKRGSLDESFSLSSTHISLLLCCVQRSLFHSDNANILPLSSILLSCSLTMEYVQGSESVSSSFHRDIDSCCCNMLPHSQCQTCQNAKTVSLDIHPFSQRGVIWLSSQVDKVSRWEKQNILWCQKISLKVFLKNISTFFSSHCLKIYDPFYLLNKIFNPLMSSQKRCFL